MRRAFFFIGVFLFASASFASIPRASAVDLSSPRFDPLPETRIRVSEDLAPFERPAPSLLSRALHQSYEQASTTNASGLAGFLSVDPHLDIEKALREPQRWNRYGYVVNNPLRYTDPDGRDARDFFDALGPAALATGSDLVQLGKDAVHAAQIREAFQGFEGAPAAEKAMAIAIAGIAIADVSTHFAAPARSAIQQASTKAGAIVLGHFPGNKLVAQKIGAEFLNITNWTFGRNRGWLRDALQAGKDIYLTVDPSKVRLDSTTKRELRYLAKRGWEFVYESESGLWKAVKAAK